MWLRSRRALGQEHPDRGSPFRITAPVVLALLAAADHLPAQVIDVQVVDSLSRAPVPSVIVALQGAEGGRPQRRLTDLRGRAVFEGMGLGTFRITVTGIGYARTESAPVTVRTRTDSVRRVIRLFAISIVLPEVEVSTADACSGDAVGGMRGGVLGRVWEEARKGLDITVLTEETVRPWIERWTWEGALDHRGQSPRSRADSVVYTRDPPFVTADPAQLVREGFVQGSEGNLTFYGPDARVLLDEEFLAGHCLWLDLTSRKGEGLAGLHFRPQWTRTVPEVEGTLWLRQGDWAPVELRYMYLNLPEPYGTGPRFGGALRFQAVAGIGQVVSEWTIYSPLFMRMRTKTSVGNIVVTTPETTELRGWKLSGGKARALADRLTGGAPPFQREVVVGPQTGPGALRVCRAAPRSEPGLGTIVLDVVDAGTRMPVPGVPVRVVVGDPDVQQVDVGGRELRITRRVVEVTDTADAQGKMTICDVPPGTRFVVQAGGQGAPPVFGYVTAPFDTIQLLFRAKPRTVAAGMLQGRVVDSTGAAVSEAQVLITAAGRLATTDINGRFRLEGIPDGRFEVVVRRLGYLPAQFFRQFRHDTVSVEVQLTPLAVVLPEVETRARGPVAISPKLREWARRRDSNGGGKFWDDSLLRTIEHRRLADVLQQVSGVHILRERGASHLITSGGRAGNMTRGGPCYVVIYLDGARLNTGSMMGSGDPSPPNLDDIPIDQIAAMEFYRSASEIPVEFDSPGSMCGVLAIWTRDAGETARPRPPEQP